MENLPQYQQFLKVFNDMEIGTKFSIAQLVKLHSSEFKPVRSGRSIAHLTISLLETIGVISSQRERSKTTDNKLRLQKWCLKVDNCSPEKLTEVYSKYRMDAKEKRISKTKKTLPPPPVEDDETEDYEIKISSSDFIAMKNEIISLRQQLSEKQSELSELIDEVKDLKAEIIQLKYTPKPTPSKPADMSWFRQQ